MALITCPECGQKISSQASSCPHCGAPAKKVTAAGCPVWLAIVFIAFVVVVFIIARCAAPHGSNHGMTAAKPSLSEAQSYLGLTEQDLRSKLGQPIDLDQGNSPDGPFKILHYSKEQGNETYFVIFADDGIVQSGYYKGVLFHDRQKR
jgi:hypothetical protein